MKANREEREMEKAQTAAIEELRISIHLLEKKAEGIRVSL